MAGLRIIALTLALGASAPSPLVAAPRTVLGLDGQANLRLDYRADPRPGRTRLPPLEKARLDARRIAAAPRLGLEDRLRRLVAIAEKRLPARDDGLARYRRSTARQLRREGVTLLSTFVRERTGVCRERAFLLHGLLREARVPSRVVYCEVYDARDRYRGDHAYVEARLPGRRFVLDPLSPTPVQQLRRVEVEQYTGGERCRRRAAITDQGWLYLPTRDLSYVH